MQNKLLSWSNIEGYTIDIARQLQESRFYPEYIIGIARGGSVPAIMLSHYLNVPVKTLHLSLRDHTSSQSIDSTITQDIIDNHAILIVDDINDTGNTINQLKRNWMTSRLGIMMQFHDTIRFASLVNNVRSDAEVDYSALSIDRQEDDAWIVFPWENYWIR